jgi:drug/metabolite transporter (DMT)-like permease
MHYSLLAILIMYDWIFITIFAAIMQTTRTSLQKSLKPHLSSEAITWVRYSFGLPVVICYILILHNIGLSYPSIHRLFIAYCLAAGLFQIIGTLLLVSLFSHRNFAVSTAYAKTEAIQVAIIGALLFDEYISLTITAAIIIGVSAIIIISVAQDKINWQSLFKDLNYRHIFIGIACGAAFALDALIIREAILILDSASPIMNAALTLLSIVLLNLLALGVWMGYKNKYIFREIVFHWKPSALVGITSALGSIGWFSAFALTQVAYVKTVGQIELVFSILVTQKIFREGMSRLEILAIMLIGTSILILIYNTK